MPLQKIQNSKKYIVFAEKMGISVRIIPDWQIYKLMYSLGIASIQFEDFMGLPTMALITTPPNQGELFIKNIFDYSVAIIALILVLPLFLIISVALKISSKGPVLFKQERCGLNGRRFMIYKFRTMFTGAEALRQEMEALNESDRPPPPIPAEVEKYDVWQRRRLSMKPGLTCLWQITPGRNVVSFNKWMEMDLEYIDNWSLWLDYKILLGTVKVMLIGSGR